jgi:tight adherence protein B
MSRRLAFAIPVALVALLASVSAATAAGGKVSIREVDTSAYPRIRVTVVTPKPSTKPPQIRENGKLQLGTQSQNLGAAKSIVLSVDRSQSMKGKPLAEAVAAAKGFVHRKPPADRIAVTTFATSAVLLTGGFSPSTIDADTALDSIQVDPRQGTKLYDDVILSARALLHEPFPARVIILVTDGNSFRDTATLTGAIKAAKFAKAAVYVVAIESSRFTPAPLKQLAARTGGRYYGAASSGALAAIYAQIAHELNRTWRIEYLTAAQPGESRTILASLAGQGKVSAVVKLPKGAPEPESKSLLPASAYGPGGVAVLAAIVAGLILLAYGLVFATRKADRVRARVAPHLGKTPAKREKKKKRDRLEALAGLFLITERALGKTRFWVKLRQLIDRADLPIKTVELVYLMAGCGFGLGMFMAIVASSTIFILIAFVGGTLAPVGFVWFKAKRRLNAFEAQLPDILISMAASMKAGHSFKSGLQAVVDEGYDPAGKEFKRVLTETRLGRPMDDALQEMADRIGSSNLSFIVTCVSVQTQVGGSMAGLFDMVADTVRNRQQFARKIKALTAMGRMSAYVLCGLPFLVAAGLTVINPGYMAPLYNTSAGHKLALVGLVMMGFGALLLRKIVSFKG